MGECCTHCSECDRKKVRDEKEYKDLIHRLSRIEGQVRGIREMVESDRYCVDILTQVSAIQSALNSFNKVLLSSHIKSCVVEDIRQSGADVVFVCLGAPKQELWMKKNGPATGAHLLCGLGGSLDVFAGVVERAPKFWSDHGLEWLYRLCKEPKRIGRMMKLPLFLVHVKQEKRK